VLAINYTSINVGFVLNGIANISPSLPSGGGCNPDQQPEHGAWLTQESVILSELCRRKFTSGHDGNCQVHLNHTLNKQGYSFSQSTNYRYSGD
jgi:hypothetical protein